MRSPRTLTALNLLLLFMPLCCFLVPQLSSVSFQPQAACVAQFQCCQLSSKPLSVCALLGGSCLLPLARGLLRALFACRHQLSSLPSEPEKERNEGC